MNKKLILDKSDETILTESGKVFFQNKGVDCTLLNKSKRPYCKSCLDWSERRNHLGGTLGQWIIADIYKKGWASKSLDSRAVEFSDKGLRLFSKNYAISNNTHLHNKN